MVWQRQSGDGVRVPVRRRFGLTPRGRVLLLLLHLAAGAAWLSGDDHARLAAAMLAAPLVVDSVAKFVTAPNLSIGVRPRRTQARSAFLENVEIGNRSRNVAVRDLRIGEPRTQVFDAGGAELPFLPPGASIRARLAARSPRRGRSLVRTFRATTDWPLGLFRWTLTLPESVELLSEPARVALPPDVLRALSEGPSDPSAGGRDRDAEFHSLREYRYGDDARHVHGRRSASLGNLVTKVLRGRPDPDCALIIDLRRSPGVPATPGGDAAFELHVSRAATLCDELHARAAGFHAVVIDDGLHAYDVPPGRPALDLLEHLAVARTVPWRALTPDELGTLPAATRCFWVPAGGFHDAPAAKRVRPWLLGEAAS